MKTIGLIGGMSWESSAEYYRIINQEVNRRLGAPHSAKILMDSFDFAEVDSLMRENRWLDLSEKLVRSAIRLEKAGADLIVICTNTMHKMVNEIEKETKVPILHIIDPTAEAAIKADIKKIGLLGTQFTMEQDFIKNRLSEHFHLDVLIPEAEERRIIHQIIFQELVNGIIKPESREVYRRIIQNLVNHGAQGIIFGCTEIGLLVKEEDSPVPVFDTTPLHALAAAKAALAD